MQRNRGSVIDVLFTLALFCVFCASALAVVLIGADVYTSTARNMDQNFSTRTAVSYVAEKCARATPPGRWRWRGQPVPRRRAGSAPAGTG